MSRILVTGATGFLGGPLVQQLIAAGYEVRALVRDSKKTLPPAVEPMIGDLMAAECLDAAANDCQAVLHLAAKVSFDPRLREELLQINGQGTGLLLQAAIRAGAKRFVLVSSAITSGISADPQRLMDEDSRPTSGQIRANPYLESKLAAEEAALRACSQLEVVIVNPTTVYGPGDWSLNSGSLIRQVARSPWVPVPPGGSNLVDVEDVADGIIAAYERGRPGQRYLLGGTNLPFIQLVRIIEKTIGRKSLLLPIPRWTRTGISFAAGFYGKISKNRLITAQLFNDLFSYKFYSCEKSYRELAWKSRVSPERTLEQAWLFYSQNHLI